MTHRNSTPIGDNPSPQESSSEAFVSEVSTFSPQNTVLAVLFALSFSHLLNDTLQSLLPAIYPLLKSSFSLSYTQIGPHHLHQPVHRFSVATDGRSIYG